MQSQFRFLVPVAVAFALVSCATTPPALKVADYAAILADTGRLPAHRNDDAARKPAEILEFSQVRTGDVVLELEAGRGYFTDILSGAVGPTGKVITQNPAAFAYSGPAMATLRNAGRLKNVTETTTQFDALQPADASVDKVLWYLGPHELYFRPANTNGLGDPAKSYAEIMRVLKPGGTFVVLDHAANAGAPTTVAQTIHRVDPAVVLAAAAAAGFKLEEKSTLLANPADDRSKGVFDSTIRRHTDQFLFRFRKPK